MGFNWGRGLAAGAAGALDTYGGMLKADRAAGAEQVRLDAQQAREENMIRFKSTEAQKNEQYARDKTVERRGEDAQWSRDQLQPNAEAAAAAKRGVESTPDAVAARGAMAQEKITTAVAQAEAVAKAEDGISRKRKDELHAKAAEGDKDRTPEENRMIHNKIEGIPEIKKTEDKGTKLTLNQWMTHRDKEAERIMESMPGSTNKAQADREAALNNWDRQNPRPTAKRRGQTAGQLEATASNKQKAEAGTETPEDRQALASRIAGGDKRAEAVVSLLTPEKQREVNRLVEEAKNANAPQVVRPTSTPGAPVSTVSQQAPGQVSRMRTQRGQASQGQLMQEPEPLRRGQAYPGALSR